MKNLINHCIQIHGAKKLAFLRGPDYHQSAQARFEGYCDALKEAGLVNLTGQKGLDNTFQSQLITDHFYWGAGDAAAAQLFEGRSLVPGHDFDTLAGSSDLMVLGAINYFAKHGYHVPSDYQAIGFNNSLESRVAESPLSTVHLPYAEMTKESFKILLGMMNTKKHKPVKDILLNSEVIIRESCGCSEHNRSKEKVQRLHEPVRQSSGNAEEIIAKMTKDYLKLDTSIIKSNVLPLVHSLLNKDKEYIFPLFEKSVICFLDMGGEIENLLRLLADIGIAGLNLPEKVKSLEPLLYQSIFKIREQLTLRDSYEKERCNTVLNSLKCDLLGTRDRYSLLHNLARHLPKIGINTAAIILYGDEKTSIFTGGFSSEGMNTIKEQRFPARLLVPPSLRSQFDNGIFLVQPLFIENQSLGYFIHNVSINDGVICEELRSSVSYALKGIFLLEETVRAKKNAEQAERAKTEFLQTLENGLYDPLQGIMEKLEAIEKKAGAGLHEDIKKLKEYVSSKEAEAGSLMDFTLARIDELSLQKTIFDIDELLPKIGRFPLLLGDTARLAQCFSLIREQYTIDYSASLTYGGLFITFRGVNKNGKAGKMGRAEKAMQFSLLLAERIILMHGGDFSLYQDHCTVTLPWTTLTGQEISKNTVSSQDQVLVLSDPAFLPVNFFTLTQIRDPEKALTGKTAFITWNAANADPEELVKVASLSRRSDFSYTPFLCYGLPAGTGGSIGSASSIIDAVEFALKSPRKGAILFIGSREHWGGDPDQFLAGEGENRLEKIRIDSMSGYNETVGEIAPLLILFNTLDLAAAAEVRRHPLTVMVPVIMISERIDSVPDVTALSQYSRLLICHRAAISSPEFQARIQALIGGDEILPPHTGVLVKKAILYFGQHAESHISRWKLADSVNVSEDYLTRIFHREMGLSLWDYLNRYRIFLAAEMLRKTDNTIQDIACRTGFNDQAYFCRVFKKIYGVPPGHLRKHQIEGQGRQ